MYVFIHESIKHFVSPEWKEHWWVWTDVVLGYTKNHWEIELYTKNCMGNEIWSIYNVKSEIVVFAYLYCLGLSLPSLFFF